MEQAVPAPELQAIAQLPLEERAAALEALIESLELQLRSTETQERIDKNLS